MPELLLTSGMTMRPVFRCRASWDARPSSRLGLAHARSSRRSTAAVDAGGPAQPTLTACPQPRHGAGPAGRATEPRADRPRPCACPVRRKESAWLTTEASPIWGAGKVEIHDIDFPTLELKDGPGVNPANVGRQLPHGAILKIVSTNICGSDQHMVRGRTTAPEGLILGHEITGEVIETGPGVEFIKKGDLCSVPFNIACGRCRNCKEGNTGVCENVNPDRPGSAYGYVDMGGWVGGQAEYVTRPVRRLEPAQVPRQGAGDGEDPRPDDAVGHLPDRLSRRVHGGRDVGLDGLHRRRRTGRPGGRVLGAAAGRGGRVRRRPDPRAAGAGASASAARRSTSPRATRRTRSSRSSACPRSTRRSTRSASRRAARLRRRSRGAGDGAQLASWTVTRAAGKLGIPGLYVTGDPGGVDDAAKVGSLSIRIGLGWAKSQSSRPASAR